MFDDEEKFYTWQEIERELSELELQYGDKDEVMQNLITPSVSAYWRRKLEEEKILYEKMLQTKEEEKKQIILKLQQQEQIIEDLKKQIEKIEHGEYEKLKDKFEELRKKELEIEKEKEKLLWRQQIQDLEYDKKIIEQEVERAKQEFEQQKQELLVYYNRQFNSLLEVQNQLLEETSRLEQELDKVVSTAKKEIEKFSLEKDLVLKELEDLKVVIDNLKKQKEILTNEKNFLLKNIEDIKQQNILDKKKIVSDIAYNVKNYLNEIRSLCGLIIGAINFVSKHHRYKHSVKFHYELILNSIQRILSILDEVAKFVVEYQV
ncbi:MAG: hypothetical protein ACK4WJ_01755 [Endomicrobiia bacterium]